MKKYHFIADKLVRDKGIERFADCHIETTHGIIPEEDFAFFLKKKIYEEATEAFDSEDIDHTISELCDVYEAAEALLKEYGISKEEFKKRVEEKRKERGSFSKRIYLKTLMVPEGHERLDHYLAEPDRYPIIPE